MSLFSARKRGMAWLNGFVLVFFWTLVRYFHFFCLPNGLWNQSPRDTSLRNCRKSFLRHTYHNALKTVVNLQVSLTYQLLSLNEKFGITYRKQHESLTIFQPDNSFILKPFSWVIITPRQEKLFRQMFRTEDWRNGSKKKASSFFKISKFPHL